MSKSPFQIPPESNDAKPPVAPVRRLLSPAERFQAGEIARKTETNAASSTPRDSAPRDSAPLSPANFDDFDEEQSDDAELAPPASRRASMQTAARAEIGSAGRARDTVRDAATRRARREIAPHAPNYHQKKPHAVAHKPIKSAPETEPQNDWDRAAQNSMARAALARKRSRVRRIVGRITLVAGVLLSVWAGAAALTAPQFEIKGIDVSGTHRTPLAQIKKLVDPLVGKNVFRAPRQSVEAQVAAIATVKDAKLRRVWSWPPHLSLQIAERQPILQVGAGPNWWVADAQGVAFRRADRKDNGLYQLTSPQFQPQTGKALPAALWKSARQLQATLEADNALVAAEKSAPQGKFWDLRRVYLDKNGAASLRVGGTGALKTHAELLIRLGEEGWSAKLKQARLALAYFERTGRKASELDLVSSEHPRWRPQTDETQTSETPSENLAGLSPD